MGTNCLPQVPTRIGHDSKKLIVPQRGTHFHVLEECFSSSPRIETLRKKRTIQSELDSIAGVGPTKRTVLLKYFGSVKNIKEATADEIEMVDEINPKLAKQIWKQFHFVNGKHPQPE